MAKPTQRLLDAILIDQAGETIRDAGELLSRMRVKADGALTMSFYCHYQFKGKSRKVFAALTSQKPLYYAKRDSVLMKVAEGIAPAADKKVVHYEKQEANAVKLGEIEAKRIEDLTFKDMFDSWILDRVRRKDGNAELKRLFSAGILPIL
jgi:hypothetical protein